MAHQLPEQCHSACLDSHRMEIKGVHMVVCKYTEDCEKLGCKCHVFSYDERNPNSPWERGNGPNWKDPQGNNHPDEWIDPIPEKLPNGGWGIPVAPHRHYFCYCVEG
jgi:hypothetical protein